MFLCAVVMYVQVRARPLKKNVITEKQRNKNFQHTGQNVKKGPGRGKGKGHGKGPSPFLRKFPNRKQDVGEVIGARKPGKGLVAGRWEDMRAEPQKADTFFPVKEKGSIADSMEVLRMDDKMAGAFDDGVSPSRKKPALEPLQPMQYPANSGREANPLDNDRKLGLQQRPNMSPNGGHARLVQNMVNPVNYDRGGNFNGRDPTNMRVAPDDLNGRNRPKIGVAGGDRNVGNPPSIGVAGGGLNGRNSAMKKINLPRNQLYVKSHTPTGHLVSTRRTERQEAVVQAFKHAWKAYKLYAWGKDEVQPVSHTGSNFFNGLGLTLVDSLDTLWLMGLKDDFSMAREWVATSLDIENNQNTVSLFETTIRVLGGLLSAYHLSEDQLFLDKAVSKLVKRLKGFM